MDNIGTSGLPLLVAVVVVIYILLRPSMNWTLEL